MSTLYKRLKALLEEGHSREAKLRDDMRYAPVGKELRGAAVLIAVTEREEPGVLLLHRPLAMRSHAGQVAFPGGKIDAGEDAITAALREANEELGIEPSLVRVVGETDHYRTGSGFHITPVLGVVPPDLTIVPNPDEVDSWFEVPLRFLLDPGNHAEKSIIYGGVRRYYLDMPWHDHYIWGATAAMIHNLSRRIGHEHF